MPHPSLSPNPDGGAVAGKEFVYELKALDLNTDQELIFKVFDAPEGVSLSEGSIVRWTPGIDQINERQFKVSVTDGFVTNVQTVTLFVNALPEITSGAQGRGLDGSRVPISAGCSGI